MLFVILSTLVALASAGPTPFNGTLFVMKESYDVDCGESADIKIVVVAGNSAGGLWGPEADFKLSTRLVHTKEDLQSKTSPL